MANVDVARFCSNARYPVAESEASSGSCSVEGPEVGFTVRREVLRTTAHGHQIDHLRQNGRLMALTISIPCWVTRRQSSAPFHAFRPKSWQPA